MPKNRHFLLLITVAALSYAVLNSANATVENLPRRETPRPETTNSVPHVQIGVEAMPD